MQSRAPSLSRRFELDIRAIRRDSATSFRVMPCDDAPRE